MNPEPPLLIEIIAYAPTAFYHCTHCEVAWRSMGLDNSLHDEQVRASLPAEIAQEYQEISDWVRQLFQAHCDRVVVKIIDAASIEGFIKTFRHRIRRYPLIIVDGQYKFPKEQLSRASDFIAHQLLQTAAVGTSSHPESG